MESEEEEVRKGRSRLRGGCQKALEALQWKKSRPATRQCDKRGTGYVIGGLMSSIEAQIVSVASSEVSGGSSRDSSVGQRAIAVDRGGAGHVLRRTEVDSISIAGHSDVAWRESSAGTMTAYGL